MLWTDKLFSHSPTLARRDFQTFLTAVIANAIDYHPTTPHKETFDLESDLHRIPPHFGLVLALH